MFEVSQIATPGNQSGAIEGMGMEVIEPKIWSMIQPPKNAKIQGAQVMGYLCAGSNRTRVS